MAKAKAQTGDDKSLSIIFLRVIGLQRISATPVEIEFPKDGGVKFIEGKNSQGKTSCLKGLEFAIVGKSALSEQPINTGLDQASVEIGLSNGRRIIRHIKRKGDAEYTTSLELIGADGEKFQSAESTVREWLGDPGVSLDPLAFGRMEPKKRRALLALLIGFDISQSEADERLAEQKRRTHSQVHERAKLNFDKLDKDPATALPAQKPEVVDIGGLTKQINEAIAQNEQTREAQRKASETHTARLADLNNTKAAADRRQLDNISLQNQIAELEAKLKEGQDALQKLSDAIPQMEANVAAAEDEVSAANDLPWVDTAPIQKKIEDISELNKAAYDYENLLERRKAVIDSWKQESQERERLTAAVEKVRAERTKALQDAIFPVEGLGFGEEDCTFNGLDFEQASQSEQIKVGLGIAMAQNPTLKFITSYDGSLLDEDNLKVVDEMTRGRGFTLALEDVQNKPTNRDNSVFIEDGAVKADA